MVTQTNVNGYENAEKKPEQYDKGKQFYLIGIRLGHKNVKTPENCAFQVETKRKFVDVLITGLTAGIVSSQTITVNSKCDE